MATAAGDRAMGRRDPYSMVGAATRAAIDRAARCADLTALDYRVLLAVTYLLSSYSRLEDAIGARQLASIVYGVDIGDLVGGQRERVARSLANLRRAGVLDVRPGKGRMARTIVRLETCSDGDTITTGEHSSAATRSVEKHGPANDSTCLDGERNVFSPRGHSEKHFEDSSESAAARPLRSCAVRVDGALAALEMQFPAHREGLRKNRRLRQALSAQIDAGWPDELLVREVSRLSLDRVEYPGAALAARVESLTDPPVTATQQRTRELELASQHGKNLQGVEQHLRRGEIEGKYAGDPEALQRALAGADLPLDERDVQG